MGPAGQRRPTPEPDDEPALTPIAPEPETAPGGFASTSSDEPEETSTEPDEPEQAEQVPEPDASGAELAASAGTARRLPSEPSPAGAERAGRDHPALDRPGSLQEEIDRLAREGEGAPAETPPAVPSPRRPSLGAEPLCRPTTPRLPPRRHAARGPTTLRRSPSRRRPAPVTVPAARDAARADFVEPGDRGAGRRAPGALRARRRQRVRREAEERLRRAEELERDAEERVKRAEEETEQLIKMAADQARRQAEEEARRDSRGEAPRGGRAAASRERAARP